MGKGSYKNENTSEAQIKFNKRELAEKKRKSETRKSVLIGVVVLTAIVVFFAVLIICANVFSVSNKTAMETENIKVNNAMMAYMYGNGYSNFKTQYADYLSYFKLDTNVSLKLQEQSEGVTWFKYFMDDAVKTMTQYLVIGEAAKADGYTLTDENKADIDASLAELGEYAKANGFSTDDFLKAVYGNGVNLDAVRRCYELSAVVSAYNTDLVKSLVYDDDALKAYFDENPSEFLKCDLIDYTFQTDVTEDMTDEQKAAANKETKAKADKLAECKTEAEFKAALTEIFKALDSTKSDADIAQQVADQMHTDNYYDDELGGWAFSDKIKVGDTYVSEGTNAYTVYMMLGTSYYDDYKTKDVRHILIRSAEDASAEDDAKAKAEAESILALYNSGDKTAEAFGKLAEEKSADDGSNKNGGLYENVTKGVMVSEFENWIYDSSRKAGDTDIIKTSHGYHVMYFVGDGKEAWKTTAETSKQNKDYETKYAEFAAKYPVSVYDDNLNKIDG